MVNCQSVFFISTDYVIIVCGELVTAVYCYITAPDAAPSSLLYQSYPTQLLLNWKPLGQADRNGVILGYLVNWSLLLGGESGTLNVTSTSVTIRDLHVNTSYQVTVAAFTAAGTGPAAVIECRTLDSKWCGFYAWLALVILSVYTAT